MGYKRKYTESENIRLRIIVSDFECEGDGGWYPGVVLTHR